MSEDRLDRVERLLEQSAKEFALNQNEAAKDFAIIQKKLDEMAARQQYHDEAFERTDAELKRILEAIDKDAENIRALARIAEIHNQRLERLENGEA
jgi:hypothetical protein